MHCQTCKCDHSAPYRDNAKQSVRAPNKWSCRLSLFVDSLRRMGRAIMKFRTSKAFHFIVGMPIVAGIVFVATYGLYWLGSFDLVHVIDKRISPVFPASMITSSSSTGDIWLAGFITVMSAVISLLVLGGLCAGAVGIGKSITSSKES